MKKRNCFRMVLGLLGVLALLLNACGGGDDGGGGATDTTAPTVASVYPANGTTGVVVSTTVSATFSEAMASATLDTTTFTLETTSGSTAVSGTVSYDSTSDVATFTPDSVLSNNTQYTATVTTSVTDAAGNALGSDQSWSFTTAAVTAVWEQVGDQVSPATAESEDPTMLITGTTPSVGYRHESFDINLNTWDGSTWGSTKTHDQRGNINGSIYGTPGFASDGTGIFVAYSLAGVSGSGDEAFYDRIYVDRCTPLTSWLTWNAGGEVSTLWNATYGGANAYEPAIAINSGNPYVAWVEDFVAEPIATDLDDGAWVANVSSIGSTRSTMLSRDNTNDSYSTDVRTVGITVDAVGNVYFAQWESDASDQDLTNLYVTRYSSGQFTSLGDAISNDYDYNNLSVPSLALIGSDLYVAYTEANSSDNTQHVYVKKYSNGSWSTVGGGPVSAFSASNHFDSGNPNLLNVAGTLYVAWEEESLYDGPFIYVARWDSTGSQWLIDGDKLNVDVSRDALDPSLAYSSSDTTLYVAFEENVSGWPQIFVKSKDLSP